MGGWDGSRRFSGKKKDNLLNVDRIRAEPQGRWGEKLGAPMILLLAAAKSAPVLSRAVGVFLSQGFRTPSVECTHPFMLQHARHGSNPARIDPEGSNVRGAPRFSPHQV